MATGIAVADGTAGDAPSSPGIGGVAPMPLPPRRSSSAGSTSSELSTMNTRPNAVIRPSWPYAVNSVISVVRNAIPVTTAPSTIAGPVCTTDASIAALMSAPARRSSLKR